MLRTSWLALGTAAALSTGTVAFAQTPSDTYQQQLDQYQDQQRDYQDQRRAYEDRLDRYEYDRTHPATWWYSAYDHAAPEWYAGYRGSDLVGTDVDERDGRHVGQIMSFDRAPDGRIERVKILLHHDRVTWVDADEIRFDRGDRIAFVDVPRDELYASSRNRDEYRP